MISSRNENIKSLRRFTAVFVLYEFVFIFFLAPIFSGLFAQPVYNDYQTQGQSQMQSYFDKATVLTKQNDWQTFIDNGAALELGLWEKDAQLKLQTELSNIDSLNIAAADKILLKQTAQTDYNNAHMNWQNALLDAIVQERGKWKANNGGVNVPDATPADFEAAITAARTAVLSSPSLDLATWDMAIQCGVDLDCTNNTQRALDKVQEVFFANLNAELTRVRALNTGLTGTELTAFEAQLALIEANLIKEYQIREHFYTLRARNQYIAEMRVDVGSAKLLASQQSASFITDQIINQTNTTVNSMTSTSLSQANDYIASITAADFNNLGANWQERVQAIISNGLDAWNKAEEDLLAKRVEWANRQKTTLAEGAAIWQTEYDRIAREKDKWLTDVQVAIQNGRAQWDAKFTQFASQRSQAETQLQQFISAENSKWTDYNGKLSDMVMTGGSAIRQAKDAVEYYNNLIGNRTNGTCAQESDPTVCSFYISERDYFLNAMGRFEVLLSQVRDELRTSMRGSTTGAYSPDYLVDRRIYAGTLPAEIAAQGASGFKAWLSNRLNTFTEDMVLYDRDLRDQISKADVNSSQAQVLSTQWNTLLTGAFTVTAFQAEIDSLGFAYQDHKDALNALLAQSAAAGDTDIMVRDKILQYLADNSNTDALLFANVSSYFKGAGFDLANGAASASSGGYYLIGNQNDPYLMTQAEYEWEMLRNERNYYARRLAQAQAVYDYAQMAQASIAGVELAAVTKERADVSKMWMDISELKYLLLKGDITLAPAVKTSQVVRDSELTRLLTARGIDVAAFKARENQIISEKNDLQSVVGATMPAQAADLNGLIALFDKYLSQNGYYLLDFRNKLVDLQNSWTATADINAMQSRFTQIQSAASDLIAQLAQLETTYKFSQMDSTLIEIKGGVDPVSGLAVTGIMEQNNLVEIGNSITAKKDQIRILSADVQAAQQAMLLQQDLYKQVKKNYDILALPGVDQIIQDEMVQAGAGLAVVSNRMTFVNNVASVNDVVTASELDYYLLLQNRQSTQNKLDFATNLIDQINALDASKARQNSLEFVIKGSSTGSLANNDAFAGKSIDQIAQLLIDAQNNPDTAANSLAVPLIDTTTGPTKSWDTTINLFNTLSTNQASYTTALNALNNTRSNDPTNTILITQQQNDLLNATEALRQNIDGFILAIGYEKDAYTKTVEYLLNNPGDFGNGATQLSGQVFGDQLNQAALRRTQQMSNLNQSTADMLVNIFQTQVNDLKSGAITNVNYDNILQAVNDQIGVFLGNQNGAGDPGSAWDASSYKFSLFDGKINTSFSSNLETLWSVRNYLQTAEVKVFLDGLSTIPPPDNLVQLQSFFSGLQTMQSQASLFNQVYFVDQPKSPNDAWVQNFFNNRSALQNNLQNLLNATTVDSQLLTDYQNFIAGNANVTQIRNTLAFYTGHYITETDPLTIRSDIQKAIDKVSLELSNLSSNYQSVWAREIYFAKAADIQNLQNELLPVTNLKSQNTALEIKIADLQTLLATINPLDTASINSINAEIAANQQSIANNNTTIQGFVSASGFTVSQIEQNINLLSGYMSEIASAGSTLSYVGNISPSLWQYDLEMSAYQLMYDRWADVQPNSYQAEIAQKENQLVSQIKSILGFYETNSYGTISTDALQDPVLSQNFWDTYGLSTLDANGNLSTLAVNANLSTLLAGNQTGSNLQKWADKLISYLEDTRNQKNGQLSSELKAAIVDLENAIIGLLSAKAIIANKDFSSAQITAESKAVMDLEITRLDNIGKVLNFYGDLEQSLSNSTNSPIGPLDNLLRITEKSTNQSLRTLFADPVPINTVPDNTSVQQSITQIFTLADRIRADRDELYKAKILTNFAQQVKDAMTGAGPFDIQTYLDGIGALQTSTLSADIAGMSTVDFATFSAALNSYLDNSTTQLEVYHSLIRDYMKAVPAGTSVTVVQQDILNILTTNNFRKSLESKLVQYADQSLYLHNVDIAASTNNTITDFLTSYAQRATNFNTDLSSMLAGIADTVGLSTAQTNILNWLVNRPGEQADFKSKVTGIINGMNPTATTVDLKVQIQSYLATLADPTATDIAAMTTLVEQNELYQAQLTSMIAGNFDPAAYPVELQNFMALKLYDEAKTAYTNFLALKNSSIPEEQALASLNLSALPGNIARIFYMQDVYNYTNIENTTVNYLSANGPASGTGSINDYINSYLTSRNTVSPALGSSFSSEVKNLVSLSEFARIQNDTAGAVETADISQYFSDYTQYLLMCKFENWVAQKLLTQLVDAAGNLVTDAAGNAVMTTEADIFAAFDTYFAQFMTDPVYSVGGNDLQTQLSSMSYKVLYDLKVSAKDFLDPAKAPASRNTASFLPYVFPGLSTTNTYSAAYTNPSLTSYVPSFLTSIPGYDTVGKGYFNMLSATMQESFAKREVQKATQAAYVDGRWLSTPEIQGIIQNTGLSFSPTMATMLDGYIRDVNRSLITQGSQSLQEAYSKVRAADFRLNTYGTAQQNSAVMTMLTQDAGALSTLSSLMDKAMQTGAGGTIVQNLAKQNQGGFMRALLESQPGAGPLSAQSNAYLAALTVPETASFNAVVAEFGNQTGAIVPADWNALKTVVKNQGAALESYFNEESAYSFIFSSGLQNSETALKGSLKSLATDAQTTFANDNFNEIFQAFAEYSASTAAGTAPVYSAATTAFLTDPTAAAIEAQFVRLTKFITPQAIAFFIEEQASLNTFFNSIQNSDAERQKTEQFLMQPSLLSAYSSLDIGYDMMLGSLLLEKDISELAESVNQTLSGAKVESAVKKRQYNRNRAVASELNRFALYRGEVANIVNGMSNFKDFRTYMGNLATANDNANNVTTNPNYQVTTNVNAPSTGMWTEQYMQANNNSTDVAVLLAGNYDSLLKSDAPAVDANDQTIFISSNTNPAQQTGYVKTYNTVTDTGASRNSFEQEYLSNLANNYLTAVSGLNRQLAVVFKIAETGGNDFNAQTGAVNTVTAAADKKSIIDQINNNLLYDTASVPAMDSVQKSDLENVKVLLQSDIVNLYSDQQITDAGNLIQSTRMQSNEARIKLADAGHRAVLAPNKANYISVAFEPTSIKYKLLNQKLSCLQNKASTGCTTAVVIDYVKYPDLTLYQAEFNTLLSEISAIQAGNDMKTLNDQYSLLNRDYSNTMDSISTLFGKFEIDRQEYDLRQNVSDYASTPYLYTSSSSTGVPNAADAQQMLESAKAAYQNIQDMLAAQSETVRTQDKLSDLAGIINRLNAGVTFSPLTTTEQGQMAAIQQKRSDGVALTTADQDIYDRYLYNTYANYIEKRQTYITETWRNIRIQKANAIVAAEVERRQAKAQIALNEFNMAKNQLISPNGAATTDKTIMANRDAMIGYLQNAYGSGNNTALKNALLNLYYPDNVVNEGSTSGGPYFNIDANSARDITRPSLVTEKNDMKSRYNSSASKSVLDAFRNNVASGTLGSGLIDGFNSDYNAYVFSAQNAFEKQNALNTTIAVSVPIIMVNTVLLISGISMCVTGGVLIATVFGIPAGTPMVTIGTNMIIIASTLIAAASLAILIASLQNQDAQADMRAKETALNNQVSSVASKINTINQKQDAYMLALAELEYFTKAPSLAEAKRRIIEYGKQNNDYFNSTLRKYDITEDDLKYMFEQDTAGNPSYVKSDGSTWTLTQTETANALDLTARRQVQTFTSTNGDYYDPSVTLTSATGLNFANGYYVDASGKQYVKIYTMDDTMQGTVKYALVIDGPTANLADVKTAAGSHWQTYNLAEVLQSGTTHSTMLQANAKAAYYQAAAAHDTNLMAAEREQTMYDIYSSAEVRTASGQGGMEYGGYGIIAADYMENSTFIHDSQLQQMANLQRQAWDIRAKELQAARADWENKVNTILHRGADSWLNATDKFKQAWNKWEIDSRQQVEDGKVLWDNKMQAFLLAKNAWIEQTNQDALSMSLDRVLGDTGDALNQQLKNLVNGGAQLPEVNSSEAINQALTEYRATRPDDAEVLNQINEGIANFNTALALNRVSSFKGFGNTSLSNSFSDAADDIGKHFQILNNVKMYEEMKKMISNFKESLVTMNENAQGSMAQAALGAGYSQSGATWTKEDQTLNKTYSFKAYNSPDVEGILKRGMDESGFVQKSSEELTSFLQSQDMTDIQIYFEEQTLILQQVFKKVAGERDKDGKVVNGNKGYFVEAVGRAPAFGDENSISDSKDTSAAMQNIKDYLKAQSDVRRLQGQEDPTDNEQALLAEVQARLSQLEKNRGVSLYKNSGELPMDGEWSYGELGGYTPKGAVDNNRTFRGLHNEESQLAKEKGDLYTALSITQSLVMLPAAFTGVGAITGLVMSSANSIIQTGTALANGQSVEGTLLTGALDLAVGIGTSVISSAFGGATDAAAQLAGNLTSTAINGGIQFLRGGIGQDQHGNLTFDYKHDLFESGKAASIITSTGLSMLGQGLTNGMDPKGMDSTMINGLFGSLGSSLQFGGKSGFALTGFNAGQFAGGMVSSLVAGSGNNAYGAKQLGSFMGNLTQLALAQNDQQRAQAAGGFGLGGWGAVGGILGGAFAQMATRREDGSHMNFGDALMEMGNNRDLKGSLLGQIGDSIGNFLDQQIGQRVANLFKYGTLQNDSEFAAAANQTATENLSQVQKQFYIDQAAKKSGNDPLIMGQIKSQLGVDLSPSEKMALLNFQEQQAIASAMRGDLNTLTSGLLDKFTNGIIPTKDQMNDVIDNFRTDTKAQTEAKIAALEKAGYDVSMLKLVVEVMRVELVKERTGAAVDPKKLTLSAKGIQELFEGEAFRSLIYLDGGEGNPGYPTVGYGHLLSNKVYNSIEEYKQANLDEFKKYNGMTMEQAIELFKSDAKSYIDAIQKNVKVPLTQAQFDALFNLAYNIGPTGLAKSPVIDAINSGNFNMVPELMVKNHVFSQGRAVDGLIRRRLEEGNLFQFGFYGTNEYGTTKMKNWCDYFSIQSKACGY